MPVLRDEGPTPGERRAPRRATFTSAAQRAPSAGLSAALLLVASACQSDAPSPRRASRVFASPRAESEPPGRAGLVEQAVERQLGAALSALASGTLDESGRAELERSLLAAIAPWGEPSRHAAAVAVVAQQLFDQARRRAAAPALAAERQRRAAAALAAELTRQLLALSAGEPAGADVLEPPLPPGYERVTWSQLGGFEYQEGRPLPSAVLELAGRRVGLPGFMLGLGEESSLEQLILVESLWGCCFGNVPALNQLLVVELPPGERVDHSPLPVLVTGRLDVGERREGDYVTSVYRVLGARVAPFEPPRRSD